MASLSQEYSPSVPNEDLSVLQNNLNQALKNDEVSSFKQSLQGIIAKTDNISDKFAQITNAVDMVIKQYPNDLAAQVEGLKAIELTLSEMLGKYNDNAAFKQAQQIIERARDEIQIRVDKRSTWAKGLAEKNLSTFDSEISEAYRKEQDDLGRRVLLRDAFENISKAFEVGSSDWFDAVVTILNLAEGVATEKEGVDLYQELILKAVDLVHTTLETGSDAWDSNLNLLWIYDRSKVSHERIEQYLTKEEVKIASVNLDQLLARDKLADYQIGLDQAMKEKDSEGKLLLIQDQIVAVLGHYGTDNYSQQIEALSILGSLADPKNFGTSYAEKAQGLFNNITGRLQVLANRIELGYENLEQTLQGDQDHWARMKTLDEEIFNAKQLRRDVQGGSVSSYDAQKTVITGIQEAIKDYKGASYDLLRTDIENRLQAIADFKPSKPSHATSLEVALNLWELLPDDQISALKQTYNDALGQIAVAIEENNAIGLQDAQEKLQAIKELIDTYKLADVQSGFAKNVDSGIDYTKNILHEAKPIELTLEERNVLTKLAGGQPLSLPENALLAGIGVKKIMSFIVSNLTPENLDNANKIANIMEKAPKIANITGKVMNFVGNVGDKWYVKMLLAGSQLVTENVAVPLAKRFLTPLVGEKTMEIIGKVANVAQKGGKVFAGNLNEIVSFTNGDFFKQSAEVISTGGKVVKSVTSILNGLASNVRDTATAQNTDSIPQKELTSTYDAVSSLARRLEQLGHMEPDLSTEEQQPVKQGFFARVADQFKTFVENAKSWVRSLFTGDTGIGALEKKYTAAQKAYKSSPSDINAQEALALAAKNLHDAYQELTSSVAVFKQLSGLRGEVGIDKEVAGALDKGAVNSDILDQIAAAVFQDRAYEIARNNALNELSQFIEQASKGTGVEGEYQKLVNKLIDKDYITKLSEYQKNINELNKAFVDYQTKLKGAIDKVNQQQPSQQGTTTNGQEQVALLGGN